MTEVISELRDFEKDPEFYTRQTKAFVKDLSLSSHQELGAKTTAAKRKQIWDAIKNIKPLDTAEDFCSYRAEGVRMLASLQGIPEENIKKIWAYGHLIHETGGWNYHVGTAVLGDDNRWYVIDTTLPGPVLVDEWIKKVQEYDMHNLLRLRIVDAHRQTPMLDKTWDLASFQQNSDKYALLIPTIEEQTRLAWGARAQEILCDDPYFSQLIYSAGRYTSFCK